MPTNSDSSTMISATTTMMALLAARSAGAYTTGTRTSNSPGAPTSILGGAVAAPVAAAAPVVLAPNPNGHGAAPAQNGAPLSELWDLTDVLGPKVAAHNARHAGSRKIRLLAKAEFLNPASQSHKDRIAQAIVGEAAKRGDLTRKDGGRKTILAASSGNTGTAMARIGTNMGYAVTIITNRLCSQEKCAKIVEGGATLWLAEDLPSKFDFLKDVKCYMEQERVLCERYPDEYYSVNQYENPDNAMAHYETTAQEIWAQSGGAATHFVMAASTGGTIMGVGKYLKECNPAIQVVLSDPHKSKLAGILAKARGEEDRGEAMLEEVAALQQSEGGVQVEGAGKQSLTRLMKSRDGTVLGPVDTAVRVHDFAAFDACRALDRERGLRVGGSAGLNLVACRTLAAKAVAAGEGACLTTLLCDDGNKYASKIFDDAWMAAHDPRPMAERGTGVGWMARAIGVHRREDRNP